MPDVKTDKRFVPYMVAEQPSLVAIKQAKILPTIQTQNSLKCNKLFQKNPNFDMTHVAFFET